MKHRAYRLALALVALLASFTGRAQGNLKELAERIGNERNFQRIRQKANAYFEEEEAKERAGTAAKTGEPEEEFESVEGFYRRWAWFMGGRLDAAGNIADYRQRNLEAIAASDAQNRTALATSNSNWVLQGPNGYTPQKTMADGLGRVDCIAFHPTDANVMYAGTPMGGLFKTTDGGQQWKQLMGYLPFLGVAAVVVNQTNGNELWVLAGSAHGYNTWGIFSTGGGGRVYHSTDAGLNWTAGGEFPGIGNGQGYDMVQHPALPNTLFAATERGVYRTSNGGADWTATNLTAGVYDLEIHPSVYYLYAVGSGFLQWSSDGGTVWNTPTFDTAINGMTRGSLAISPSNSQRIYLLAGPAKKGRFYGLFRSDNTGLAFTRQSKTPNIFDSETDGSGDFDQSGYTNCVVVNPSDSYTILTGGAAIWQSTSGGVFMDFNTYYWNSATQPARYVHPDIHALKRNPLNNKVYACTDGGVYVSSDFGASWAQKTLFLSASQIFHMTLYKNNLFLEAFGSQDNGMKIRRAAGGYEQFAGGDGYAAQFSLNDSSVLYASINEGFYKYTAFGNTPVAVNYPFVKKDKEHWYILPKVTPSATNTEILFAGCLDTLSRSTDGGNVWTRVIKRSNWDIAYAPSNPAYVYTAGGADYSSPSGFTLSRSTAYGNGGWQDITGALAAHGQRAMKFAVHPQNHLQLYVCLGGYTAGQKVYRSTNGGSTWGTNASYNLPNVPVNALAVDAAGNVYAGTDIGVYVLPNGSTQWVAFYNNLPRVPITELVVNDAKGFIKAATFGCGIWQTDLYSTCPATVNVAFEQIGRQAYEAGNFLNAFDVTMSGGYDFTEVKLRSGNYIIFTPGSDLKNGTLIASIGPCGQPFPAVRVIPMRRANARSDSSLHSPAGKSWPQKRKPSLPDSLPANKALRRKGE